jgi:hypothetical protein
MPELDLAESPLLAAGRHLTGRLSSSRERRGHGGRCTKQRWRCRCDVRRRRVCNLCASRLGFLVTCLAAWRARCLLVLPPSGGNADIAAVLNASALTLVVGDPKPCPNSGATITGTSVWRRSGSRRRRRHDDLAGSRRGTTSPYLLYLRQHRSSGAAAERCATSLAARSFSARLESELDVDLAPSKASSAACRSNTCSASNAR